MITRDQKIAKQRLKSELQPLIKAAREALEDEIGDDPLDSDWDVEDYPVIKAFQSLLKAEEILA